MTVTVIDNFDSYTNGDLNGQGTWSGSTSFDVESTVFFQGTKAVENASTAGTNISKSVTSATTGIFGVYLRGTGTPSDFGGFRLLQSGTPKADIYITDTDMQVTNTVTTESLGTWAANTWYFFEIEIDVANTRVRGRVNDGAWSNYLTVASFTGINGVRLQRNSGAGTFYYDYITYNDGINTATPMMHHMEMVGGLM